MSAGCGGDTETTAPREHTQVSSGGDGILLVNVSYDPVNRILYSTVEKGGVRRELAVRPLRSSEWPVGISADISDHAGDVLFTLEIAWDEPNPGNVWFREASGSDEITAVVEQVGDRVSEVYTINGVVRSYNYPAIDPEAREHAVRFLYEGLDERIKDPDVLEYIGVLGDFGNFYADNAPSSLSLNADGDILLKVLGDTNLVTRASIGKSSGKIALLEKRAQQVCSVAWVCAALKCTFGGGWGNPLCIACGGTSLVCNIATLACTFIVNCD